MNIRVCIQNFEIGQNLKSYRKKAKYSLSYVANALGVDRSTVAKWERGAIIPGPDNLRMLADLYMVDNVDCILYQKTYLTLVAN
jgi:transcriptional regulator with XRE-family HTH domain